MPKRAPSFFTAQQVADLLGIESVTVRQMAARRGLGQRFSARVLLFTDADVDNMRQRNQPGRPKSPPKSVQTHKDK